MILLVIPFLAVACTGLSALSCLRLTDDGWPGRIVRGGIGMLIGFALHSLWTLIWLTTVDRTDARAGFFAFDLLLPACLAGAGLAWRRRTRNRERDAASQWNATAFRTETRWWFGAAAALTVIATATTALVASVLPQGGYHAWAVWNTKAIWMAQGGAQWSAFLTDPTFLSAHPDYPLMIPSAVARLWMMAGNTATLAPQMLGVITVPVVLAIVGAAAWSHRGALAGVAACVALLGCQQMLITAGLQYADVPLACAYVATAVALANGQREGGVSRWYLIAGLTAGAAMWIKNEGNLFVAGALVSASLTSLTTGTGLRIAMRRGVLMTAGLLPFLAAAIFVKETAPANLIVSMQTPAVLTERMLDVTRHLTVIGHVFRMAGAVLNLPVMVLSAVFLVLRGRTARLGTAAQTLLLVASVAVGYHIVFVLTPYPLDWHLTTASDRLFIHLWPTLVFGLVLASGRDAPLPEDQHVSESRSIEPGAR